MICALAVLDRRCIDLCNGRDDVGIAYDRYLLGVREVPGEVAAVYAVCEKRHDFNCFLFQEVKGVADRFRVERQPVFGNVAAVAVYQAQRACSV